MNKLLRYILIAPALLFLLMGIRWLIDPESASSSQGMPLLSGAALSTQIGDISAHFLSMAVMIGLGIITLRPVFFYITAAVLLCTAFGRTVGWLFHDAALVTSALSVEIVVAFFLLIAAYSISNYSSP